MCDNECEYYSYCMNNDKCYRCFNNSLLKTKKTSSRFSTKQSYKNLNKKDSWKTLEQDVADRLNNLPTIQEARRSRASGALPFEKGDVIDSILFPECKERTGRELKTGEKTISLKKEWLLKAKEECRGMNKTMCLPFRFKGDEEIYAIIDMNDLAELVTTLKTYMLDNEQKEKIIKKLKERNS